MLADAMRYVCTMCCVVYTCQYILALSIEQPRNAENALLSFVLLKRRAEPAEGGVLF